MREQVTSFGTQPMPIWLVTAPLLREPRHCPRMSACAVPSISSRHAEAAAPIVSTPVPPTPTTAIL